MPSNWERIVSITKGGVKSIGMIKQKIQRGKKIALLIDGPNILRKEFNVHLEDIVVALEELGTVSYTHLTLPTKRIV